MSYGAASANEEELRLRLTGLQHEVEKSANLVRKLALIAIILVILLILLLITLHLYHVMQYARVVDVEAFQVEGKSGVAEISYEPACAGKIEFVRDSEGLSQTLTEYANAPGSSEKSKGKFTWSGRKGDKGTLHATYREGLFLVTKDLPLQSPSTER
jgi:hypothetical protein